MNKALYRNFLWLPLGLLVMLQISCQQAGEEVPDISHVQVELKVRRLEREMAQLKTHQDILRFLDENPQLTELYFERRRFPSDSLLAVQIGQFLAVPENDTLLADIERIFGDFSTQLNALEEGFRYLKYYYPDFQVPQIYTIASGFTAFGFGQDIFIGKDFIVIGLDYFAGKQARFLPPGVPKYILKRYQPEYVVPSVFLFLSRVFNNYDSKDITLLSDMIFYGKSLYFMDKTLPYVPDSLLIGYTAKELADCEYNERRIWGHFVERNLFYEKVNFEKNRYVGERPNVLEIGDKCPGRIGWWLGWQIVRKYAENTQSDLPMIMDSKNAQDIFLRAGYKPE